MKATILMFLGILFWHTCFTQGVGIGTDDPHAPLQFANDDARRKIVLREFANNDHQFHGFGISGDTMRYQIQTALGTHLFSSALNGNLSRELMHIRGNGNVGIGGAPSNRLDIHNGHVRTGEHVINRPLYVTGNLNEDANGIEFRHWDGTHGIGFGYTTMYATGNTPNQDIGIKSKGTGAIKFVTSTGEKMRMSHHGFVGIGVTDPQAPLHLANSIINRKVILYDDHNNENMYYGFGINFNILRYQVPHSGTSHVFYAGTSPGSSQELMRIQGDGFVGIGTSTPHSPLHFGHYINNRKIILHEDHNNEHQFYGFGINDGVLRYQIGGPFSSHIFYAGTSFNSSQELFRIRGNGNIKIAGRIEQEVYHTPTLLNGFSNYGNGYEPAAYYKDKEGVVHLRGMVNIASSPAGKVIFQLDPGYFSPVGGRLVFMAFNNDQTIRIDVTTSGEVIAMSGIPGWFSLSQISFHVP